jgi:hypothetical protein
MMIDDPAAAAEQAGDAAAVAGAAAEVAADAAADAAAEPAIDPNALIAADVAIATEQEATERARIDARAAVKIAELQQEEPPWLNDIRECLTRLETMLAAMASPSQSTPAPSIEIIQDSPTIVEGENPGANVAGPEAAAAEVEAEVVPEAVAEAPAPAPARRGPRWI